MKKTQSIKENRQFRALYARGKTSARKTLAVYSRKSRSKAVNHLGITVSVKLGGAVVRNRAKRRIREAYRLHEGRFREGFDLVIVARHAIVDAPFGRICDDLLAICAEQGLLKESAS